MRKHLQLDILSQPDETTCGPTCLHAVYRYYGDGVGLGEVVARAGSLDGGGTLAVMLACHALRRGYRATIYTYNLRVFDPTWAVLDGGAIAEKLRLRLRNKRSGKLAVALRAYIEFLELGGEVRFEDLTAGLILRHLRRDVPILTGLSATYLYQCPREYGDAMDYDDVRGDPAGHFVVLCGYEGDGGRVLVADPLQPNPAFESNRYLIGIDRAICSILLGVLTYDANLLVVEPGEECGRRVGGVVGGGGAGSVR